MTKTRETTLARSGRSRSLFRPTFRLLGPRFRERERPREDNEGVREERSRRVSVYAATFRPPSSRIPFHVTLSHLESESSPPLGQRTFSAEEDTVETYFLSRHVSVVHAPLRVGFDAAVVAVVDDDPPVLGPLLIRKPAASSRRAQPSSLRAGPEPRESTPGENARCRAAQRGSARRQLTLGTLVRTDYCGTRRIMMTQNGKCFLFPDTIVRMSGALA